MDNLLVGLTGATCYILAQSASNWFDSVTPLGIVALVVYYFLCKFDKKLDVVEDQTCDVKKTVDQILERVNHDNGFSNTDANASGDAGK